MYWSFALAAGSMTGLWIAGKRPMQGWIVLLGMEVLWCWYSVATKQYGLGVLCLAYGIIYCANTIREWKRNNGQQG
jgi:hypothetical protein